MTLTGYPEEEDYDKKLEGKKASDTTVSSVCSLIMSLHTLYKPCSDLFNENTVLYLMFLYSMLFAHE